MKLLVISSEFPPGPGGIGQHAASFALAMAKQGADVRVLTNQDYAEPDEVTAYNRKLPRNITIQSMAVRSGKTTPIKRMRQALQAVKTMHPNRVFVSGRFPLWVGAVIKIRFPKQRVEGFVHGTEITLTGSTLSNLTKWAYGNLDRVIAVSNFTKSLLNPRLPQDKIMVLPNGIDDALLASAKNEREIYAWPGQPKLLTVGNLTPRKGQHRVVSALPEILKSFPDAHYHMVGLPTDKEKIMAQAKALNVAQAITIHGRLASREELYRAYASADVFIMLSENQKNGDLEGFGIAILEANAFGLPAIGAKGCGIEDAISTESGLLVDGNNPVEITHAVQQLVKHKRDFALGTKTWAAKHNWDELVNVLAK